MSALWLVLLACGSADSPDVTVSEPAGRLHAEEVSLVVGDRALVATMATAFHDPDGGTGGGTQVEATVQAALPLVVEGEASRWDLKAGQVVFEGSVVASRGDTVLRCATLTALLQGEDITEVVAVGAVRVERGARRVTADRATLDVATGALVLTGSPKVVDGGRTLVGERVVVFLDDDRLECSDCRLEVADPFGTQP